MTDRGMIVVGLVAVCGVLTFAPVYEYEALRILGLWFAFGTIVAILVIPGGDDDGS